MDRLVFASTTFCRALASMSSELSMPTNWTEESTASSSASKVVAVSLVDETFGDALHYALAVERPHELEREDQGVTTLAFSITTF